MLDGSQIYYHRRFGIIDRPSVPVSFALTTSPHGWDGRSARTGWRILQGDCWTTFTTCESRFVSPLRINVTYAYNAYCPGRRYVKPLIFVGHSFGGLVTEQAVVKASSAGSMYEYLAQLIGGVVLFGTPHQGSN